MPSQSKCIDWEGIWFESAHERVEACEMRRDNRSRDALFLLVADAFGGRDVRNQKAWGYQYDETDYESEDVHH